MPNLNGPEIYTFSLGSERVLPTIIKYELGSIGSWRILFFEKCNQITCYFPSKITENGLNYIPCLNFETGFF